MVAAFDPERQRVWTNLRLAYLHVERAIRDDLLRERAFDLADFELLAMLASQGGKSPMTDLVTALVLSKSNLTRLVDRVEADDLVRRERDVNDGRVVHVVLTSTGRETYRRVLPAYQRSVRRHAEVISDSDVAAVNRALTRTIDRLNERPSPPPTARW
jgi:DNA-binding MarR family transcriptional regulator